jgi:hypothetical protein
MNDKSVPALRPRTARIGFALPLTLFAFLSLRCFNQPLEPVAPSWDTNLSLPLANRHYTLLEIVEKDTNLLRAGVGGEIVYASSIDALPTFIGDVITVSPNDTVVTVNFGTFDVTGVPLYAPLDIPWLPRGSSTPIPDTTLTFADVLDTIPTFQRIIMESGTISLMLENNLPVAMEVVNPIELRDSQGGMVASFVYLPATIPANSSRTATDNLAGRELDNTVRISGLRFHTPGSTSPVPIPTGTLFAATLSTTGLRARYAEFAEIPPQRLSDNDTTYLPIDDSTLVRELHLRTGRLQLQFASRVNLPMLFKFRLNELRRPVGAGFVAYEDSLFLPARGSGSSFIDLAGSRIQSQSASLISSLEVVSSVILPAGSGQPVTVSDTDKVVIAVSRLADIVVDSAVAVLRPSWVSVGSEFPVSFGELPTRFSGQLNIPSASLGFATVSSIGFPMDLDIRVGGRTAGGDSVFLQVPASEKRLQTGNDLVQFDPTEVGQFLSQFSGQLPERLRITGRVLVNPPDVYVPTPAGVGTVGRNSSFGGNLDLQVPLMLGIVNGTYRDTLVIGDTTADGLRDYTINKDRLNDVNHGTMHIEVQNGMPLELGISLRLLDRTGQSILLVPQSGQGVQVTAAAVDGGGNVVLPAQSRSSFTLSQSEVRQFNPAEFLTYSVALVTTPGSPAVRFKTSDYVRVRMWSTLSYRVNP